MQYWRKAYGPHGYRTPARKAHDIALSILAHQAQGRVRTLADYNITDPGMITLIAEAIERMTKQAA